MSLFVHAGDEESQIPERLVHQRIVAAVFKPPDLPHDG